MTPFVDTITYGKRVPHGPIVLEVRVFIDSVYTQEENGKSDTRVFRERSGEFGGRHPVEKKTIQEAIRQRGLTDTISRRYMSVMAKNEYPATKTSGFNRLESA
uniref:Transposase n=1 Tax=Caenorhabditis tropicalis TaxID=1561998 RepID=A0A1I7TVR0_9PELO